ncbi:MAG: hypothetical protein U0840_13695 [Gemmataceae bacterium]
MWCETRPGRSGRSRTPAVLAAGGDRPANRACEVRTGWDGQGAHPVPAGRRPRPGRGDDRLPSGAVLHGRLDEELTDVLAGVPTLPPTADVPGGVAAVAGGTDQPITLRAVLPPLRVLLVLDNLAGHRTPELVLWMFAHGVMPLFTPLGGSWLNMAESIQHGAQAAGVGREVPVQPR